MGALSVVGLGKIDAIIITGGIAYEKFFVDMVRERIDFLAPIFLYPGEDERKMASNIFGMKRTKIKF